MVADSNGDQVSGAWVTSGDVEVVTSGDNHSNTYKSWRAWKIDNGGIIRQSLPKIYTEPDEYRTYYFSCMVNTVSGSANIGIIESSSTKKGVDLTLTRGTSGWELWSAVFTCRTNSDGSFEHNCVMGFKGETINTSGNSSSFSIDKCRLEIQNGLPTDANLIVPMLITQFMLVDLTDTFGVSFNIDDNSDDHGMCDWKQWLDNNIIEHETYVNFGTVSSIINNSNYETIFTPSQLKALHKYNYLALDSTWEPRDYFYLLETSPDYTEGYLYSEKQWALTHDDMWYSKVTYWSNDPNSLSADVYWPEIEPLLSNRSVDLYYPRIFNGGGGMQDWKIASFYGDRNLFPDGSYKWRFDINNKNKEFSVRLTDIVMSRIANDSGTLKEYNTYNDCEITVDDINKQWCDRWVAGRSHSMLHIKDPNNKQIKFKPVSKVNRQEGISSSYTKAALDSYVGLKADTWAIGNEPNSHLSVGDIAYLQVTISDDSELDARFFVRVVSVDITNSVLVADNLYYETIHSDRYDLPCDICCNDIEIRPEMNEIKFDYNTGTIYCKRLELLTEPEIPSTNVSTPLFESDVVISDTNVCDEWDIDPVVTTGDVKLLKAVNMVSEQVNTNTVDPICVLTKLKPKIEKIRIRPELGSHTIFISSNMWGEIEGNIYIKDYDTGQTIATFKFWWDHRYMAVEYLIGSLTINGQTYTYNARGTAGYNGGWKAEPGNSNNDGMWLTFEHKKTNDLSLLRFTIPDADIRSESVADWDFSDDKTFEISADNICVEFDGYCQTSIGQADRYGSIYDINTYYHVGYKFTIDPDYSRAYR